MNKKNINCSDIYEETIRQQINSLKRFRELWLKNKSSRDYEIFSYADDDFYFYSFAIERQEKSSKFLIRRILFKLMDRYGIYYVVPKESNAPFDFIVLQNNKKMGFRFSDFYDEDNIPKIIKKHRIDLAYIIRTYYKNKACELLQSENNTYKSPKLKLRVISLESFFKHFFSIEEYKYFLIKIEEYLSLSKEITGYKSIKFLSSMNLASQKSFAEKKIKNWDYLNSRYLIVDKDNEKVKSYAYLSTYTLQDILFSKIENNYITNQLYKTLLGSNEYAKSFITSEWLYHSLEGRQNFDFTSIISGYLKSIEQLLYYVVMINLDNNCKIAMRSDKAIREKANENGILQYKLNKYNGEFKILNNKYEKNIYIDFVSGQSDYMDNSIGTYEYFLRYNPHIFIDPTLASVVSDMVSCFRSECRNGYFHKHNLYNWDIVKMTRSNAFYLYFMILGTCKIGENQITKLGILNIDRFDLLCQKIREFRNYNIDFIFEYEDGKRINLVYDFKGNTIEFTNEGIEHYESLLFFKVDDFSLETYESLDRGINDNQKILLTRNNLLTKIWGVHRNMSLEEIIY